MAVTKIETPREFFDHVVNVDVSEFKANRLDLRLAYHACISLLSLRDWIVVSQKGKPWLNGGVTKKPFHNKGQLQECLKAIEPKFGIIKSIANAAKHMVLSDADTRVHGFGGPTGRFFGGISGAPISAVPISGGGGHILVKIKTQFHDVEDCILTVHGAWLRLLRENSW